MEYNGWTLSCPEPRTWYAHAQGRRRLGPSTTQAEIQKRVDRMNAPLGKPIDHRRKRDVVSNEVDDKTWNRMYPFEPRAKKGAAR